VKLCQALTCHFINYGELKHSTVLRQLHPHIGRIVFIDEIDKIVSSRSASFRTGDPSSEGVQRDLLPIIEGELASCTPIVHDLSQS